MERGLAPAVNVMRTTQSGTPLPKSRTFDLNGQVFRDSLTCIYGWIRHVIDGINPYGELPKLGQGALFLRLARILPIREPIASPNSKPNAPLVTMSMKF